MGYRQLTQEERYVIARLLHQGWSMRLIAFVLDRSASTISRERRRNACPHDGGYRAEKAGSRALVRRWRSRKKSQYSQQEWGQVVRLLQRRWSPEQISGRWKLYRVGSISKETIYRYIRRDRRAGGALQKYTRIISKNRRKKRGSPATRGRVQGKRHISQRPVSVQGRQRVGHWEGDTVMGKDGRHCVLTLVERKTGKLVIKKLSARNKQQANAALIAAIREIRSEGGKVLTLALDNGTEFHDYKLVEEATGVKIYFAAPYRSWERAINENTNGLIRQYLPKGMCMRSVTQAQCDRISEEINNRPRKRLGFMMPSEEFARHVRGVALQS